MWAIKWRSENQLDGKNEHFIREPVGVVKLFRTRKEARDYRDEKFGFIRARPDLRAEPHGWRLPVPVKAAVIIAAALTKESEE